MIDSLKNFKFSSFVDLLRFRALHQPDKLAFIFLQDGETESSSLTYQELDCLARAIAAQLQSLGVASGERSLLLYPPGLEFIAAFFGCLYAGVVAVPAYPPHFNRPTPRLQAIVRDAQATVVLTTTQILSNGPRLFTYAPELEARKWLATDRITGSLEDIWQETAVTSDTLAFLQYTSGSTSTPKGVMVSHGNLLHNQQIIQQAMEHTEKTIFVGWLPLFHDMGLIGNMLQPLYLGIPCILMPPVAFLQRPLCWLQAISRYKATTSGGPNFAYDLCVSKITDEQRTTLDLSSWEVAFNGAEPVRAETLDLFARTFADCGFRAQAFYPCYGMAETTLIVAGGFKAAAPVLQNVQKAALEENRVIIASKKDFNAQTLVGCGQPLQDMQIIIAHPETLTRSSPDEVGEIWVSGKSVADGYWNRIEETKHTFQAYLKDTGEGPFLRTGDLGFVQSGELFITGRLKDLIIIRGRNHYPQDIEWTVEQSHPALQPSCAAAFSVDVTSVERLTVVVEVKRTYLRNLAEEEVIRAIRQAVAENHELQVYGVLLLKPGNIPKTSSGKIQRHACRLRFLEGSLDVVASSILEESDFIESENHLTQEALLAIKPVERQMRLVSYLQEQVARVLRVVPSQLSQQQALISLGLDSLMTVDLKNRIEVDLGVVVSVANLLEGASIAQIATQVLEQLTQAASPSPQNLLTPPLQAISCNENQPLSFIQEQLWFLDYWVPGNPAYNVPVAVRLTGTLNVAVLCESINEIQRRHEILRATYPAIDGQPVQRISPPVESLTLPIVDFLALPETEQQTQTQKWLTQEAKRPFDLAEGPLFRASLLRLGEKEHILFLCTHHIIADGWSLGVFAQEFAALYHAFSNGSPSPLPELPIQYKDFAHWQRQWLQGEVLEKQLSYWQAKLAGAPPLLDLLTDYPRTAVQTFRGTRRSFVLPNTLVESLKLLSQQEEVTLFMTILAVLKILLFKWTGQTDIVVGTAVANRHQLETQKLIGCLINFLALRTQISGNQTGLELLEQVKITTLEAYSHQDCPFKKVIEVINPDRKLTQNPIYNVGFLLQNYPHKSFSVDTLEASLATLDTGHSVLDLKFVAEESSEGIVLECEFNTDLFDIATIERMLGHFQCLLENFVNNPRQRISELSLLTQAERHQLLVEWNKIDCSYPNDKCIHELFEVQVEQTPDAVALVFEDEQITYRELDQRANQLAHYLRDEGVEPEVLVGICLERSLDMVVGILGILKAGGAYVPLEPSYPQERLAFILLDAQIPILLTQESLLEVLADCELKVVCLDTKRDAIANKSTEQPASGVMAQNLAYVIYTSGSTGKPKGVLVNHANVVRLFKAVQTQYQFYEQDVWTLFHSIAFDFSVWELWGGLLYGGKVVVVPYLVSRSPEAFYALLCKERVTVLNQTPSAFRQLMKVEESLGIYQNWNLRLVIFGGEALELQSLKPYFERHGDQCPQLVNMYGITETTVHVTYRPLTLADLRGTASVIGRPISDLQVYLLDQYRQPVPIGVPGEMYIGGAGVARGYLNRPELTTERFIANPFNDKPEARLYKSGDLARYLSNGDIEYLGRIDHQIKIRGFRIELGEIEAVLSQHPALSETVVIAQQDVSGDQRLVAYLVVKHEQVPTVSDLRGFLKQKMPEYMVPSAFVFLNALPLTPNGKVDCRALPATDTARPKLEGTFVAPRTSTEQVLAAIWAQVLGLKQVGIYDNFFELGGHSLLATQVISQVRTTFQVEIPLRSLFEEPTVASLTERIQMLSQTEQSLKIPPIMSISRDVSLPLSFGQQRLWFLNQLEPSSPFYNIYAAVRLTGPLNVAMLEQTLDVLVQRHESLRTTFLMVEGQPMQVIYPVQPLKLLVVNLQEFPEIEREAEARQLADEEAQRPFDLARGPLLRISLLRLGHEENILLLTMHHIVSDGWSMGVLVSEIAALYEAFSNGRPSPLPELPIQYVDFAYWQQQWLQGEVLEEQLAYWQRQLGGNLPVLELPTDHRRPPVQSYRGARQLFLLPADLSEALKALSLREEVTLFMTLLAAFKTLLYHYTGQEDILVGSPIANRNQAETEKLIGLFINTLVLRTNVGGNPRFLQLLGQVRKVVLGAYTCQNLPFEKLVETLRQERYLSHTPLFQVMFILQNAPMPTLEFSGLTLTPLEVDNQTAKFDLTLELLETPNGIKGWFEYNTDLFDTSTIDRMAGNFQTLLEGIVANPEQRLSNLPLLTPAEQDQVLIQWNNTYTDYPKHVCIHQLFEAQVERTPDTVAVVFAGEQLSYRELNRQANQLAHHLRKLGVMPEVRVGIYVERSLNLVIGLLGILKAGGAYIPLAPNYPQERLAFMLQDAQVPVLLTQRRLLAGLFQHSAQVVCLDTDWETINQESSDNPNSQVLPTHNAYVLYTSGSTGQPKGVVIEHHSTVALLNWARNVFTTEDLSGVLASTSISFDLSVFELFVPLSWGGKVILANNALHLPTLPAVEEVTLINTVPSAIAELLRVSSVPSSVRTVNLAGEPLPKKLVEQLFEQTNVQQVFNLYGPSEDTTYSTFASVKPEENVSIGRPIANTEVYVLDRYLKPVPIGVRGELYIGGEGTARGYLNRPDLNAQKFICNPFSHEIGSRLYKTGDLVRYLPNGNIEYLGREDFQVKIRGYRIELGEIEAVLSQHSEVQNVVVVAQEDESESRRLVAYIVPLQESVLSVSELRSHLIQHLPEYMMPSAFVTLNALPLTPNGKVDRRALVSTDLTRPNLEAAFVAPRTSIEVVLKGIWSQILGINQIGIHDNFFELGGHSLLATQVVHQVQTVFQVELPLLTLFQEPTVARLAKVIESNQVKLQHSSLAKIRAIAREKKYLTQLVTDLDKLAEEEVKNILQQKKSRSL